VGDSIDPYAAALYLSELRSSNSRMEQQLAQVRSDLAAVLSAVADHLDWKMNMKTSNWPDGTDLELWDTLRRLGFLQSETENTEQEQTS
jgi:hypothetical protein